MLTKFVLIVIVFSADGTQYKDFVDSPATRQECEAKRVKFVHNLKRVFDQSHYVYSACVEPRGLHVVDA